MPEPPEILKTYADQRREIFIAMKGMPTTVAAWTGHEQTEAFLAIGEGIEAIADQVMVELAKKGADAVAIVSQVRLIRPEAHNVEQLARAAREGKLLEQDYIPALVIIFETRREQWYVTAEIKGGKLMDWTYTLQQEALLVAGKKNLGMTDAQWRSINKPRFTGVFARAFPEDYN